jgi:hypothetical protein
MRMFLLCDHCAALRIYTGFCFHLVFHYILILTLKYLSAILRCLLCSLHCLLHYSYFIFQFTMIDQTVY